MGSAEGKQDTRWRIQLFGRLCVARGDRCHTRFRTQKTELLLAYLAYFPRPHSREELVELLWPDAEPSAARHSLSQALSSLRHVLEPPGVPAGAVLAADRIGVGLDPDAVTTDAIEFDGALRAAGTSGGAGQASWLGRAVELYRGELLAGYYEDWILQERHELAERYFQALSQWIAHLEGAGDLTRALEYARRGVRVDPLREEAHRELIRLLAAAGQPAAALRQYRELERLLAKELGDAPTGATHALARELRAGRASCSPIARPYGAVSGPSSVPIPSRLPLRLTRFFGRESEIAQLLDLLLAEAGAPRLVTLTGPGGSGKTRLALEVAERVAEAWRGPGDRSARAPVWFVSLTDLTEARFIPDTIREALVLPRSPGVEPLEQVAAALSRQPGLLLLDNVEHLVDEGAPLIRSLLERARPLTCLLTSRRRLGLEGEREFFLLPLRVPDPADSPERLARCESVQLFVDRARAANPEFQVTPANAVAVGALCRGLEGIPLALELAAARAQVLTPAQMVAHLEERFEFLVSRRTDAPARHRTLRAAVEWSCRLLSPELRRFFGRLSVFRGGWTAAAAAAVCEEGAPADAAETSCQSEAATKGAEAARVGPALDDLEQLRECSLVQTALPAGGETAGAEMRFRMLETLREYAAEQLGPEERAALERQHAAFYLALAERAEPELWGPNQGEWLARLEGDYENLRRALAWSQAREEAEVGLRLAGALHGFWSVRGDLSEARRHVAELLALPQAPDHPAALRKALECAGSLAGLQGEYVIGRSLCQRALAIARELGEQEQIAGSLCALAGPVTAEGDYATARRYLGESLALWREVGNQRGISVTLQVLGEMALLQTELGVARALFEESLALKRELCDPRGIASLLNYLGRVAHYEGNHELARTLIQEGLAIRQELGHKGGIAWSLAALGDVALDQGDYGAARARHAESLALLEELGERADIASSLTGMGLAALGQGELAMARSLCEAGLAISREVGEPWVIATALFALGRAAQRQGDRGAACSRYMESLALRRKLGDRRGIAECLEGLAAEDRGSAPRGGHGPRQGQPGRAARLLEAAEALRERIGAPLPPDRQPEHQAQRAAMRLSLGEAAFTTARAAGRALAWEEAVAEALGETAGPAAEAHEPEPALPAPPAEQAATDLTDAEWEQLRPLLPPPSPRGRRPTDDRRTLNGILYVLRTRCRWQDLPRRYGSSTTCWRRFSQWQADGTWERLRRAAPGIPDAVE